MSNTETSEMKLYNAWVLLSSSLNTCAEEINNMIDEREDLRKQLTEAREFAHTPTKEYVKIVLGVL